jgi:hypothetical protein
MQWWCLRTQDSTTGLFVTAFKGRRGAQRLLRWSRLPPTHTHGAPNDLQCRYAGPIFNLKRNDSESTQSFALRSQLLGRSYRAGR